MGRTALPARHPRTDAAAAATTDAERTPARPPDVAQVLALQRSAGNAQVAALLGDSGTGRPLARMPLAVKGFKDEVLDTDDIATIKRVVIDAYALGDHGHVQMVMADLRVKDPKGWIEVDALLNVCKTLTNSPPRERVSGLGSWQDHPREIECNIHRFWAGGPMKDATVSNILAMQDKVAKSTQSGTPWRQYLWTSTILNTQKGFFGGAKKNPLADQLEQLRASGIEVVDVDKKWASLSVATVADAQKPYHDLTKQHRTDVEDKAIRWTQQAKEDLDNKNYEKVKWLSDLVRIVAVDTYGGVYMDTDIGPGGLDLRNNQLYHTDPEAEIPHHAPPFRVPSDYQRTITDESLGDTARERVVRHADDMVPVLNYFLASRSGTPHLERELAEMFERKELQSGMAMFGRMFVPLDREISEKPTPYAPPQQRVTPWAADLAWTTEVSQGEG